ncbi:hypothetical protein DET56_111182 [Paenibacillus pabuli]|uniref:Uncharacterized protein n=1 Tax=Paenibacillus pabuli TaxID=1472 RepID=A0A855XPG3_9BACL|nr:hypothetical protein DET56_111182 [Paenibacillus pabuli]PXW03228.1 hypothetical protein DEU73_110182 [Paenibacillus taichungensis]SEN83884.1 hypothetical protein SAMN05518670_2843 [Paenibacillus sp. OK076]
MIESNINRNRNLNISIIIRNFISQKNPIGGVALLDLLSQTP